MSGGFENPSLHATATATDQQQVARVTVSTIPVLAEMPRDDERPDFQVLVRVQAPTPPPTTAAAAVDLVAVLDVSGSMMCSPDTGDLPKPPKAGEKKEKSRLDLLKDAMNFIVNHLRAGDRLAIVAFDHNVVPEYSSAGFAFTEISDHDGGDKERDALKAKVNALKPRGHTLFAPGLDKALEILKGRSDANKRVGFIVFLSDGQEYVNKPLKELSPMYPSPGDWKKKELQEKLKAQTVHAFGFSRFHDPAAMSAIAAASAGGTFSFLREGLDKITDAFALCLGGLQTVVAADVTVELAVHDANVRITGVDSGGYGKSVAADGKSGWIAIPVLYAGEAKDFIVHLNVPRHGSGKQMLLTTHGQWRPTAAAAAVEIVEEDDLLIKRPPQGKGNEQRRRNDDDGRVMEQVLRFKVLEMVEELAKSVDLKRDPAAAAAALGARWATLKAGVVVGDGVVRRYEDYVAEMRRSLKDDGDGGAYVAAWRSSNLMQRVTTMGSPEKVVPEFKTEAIEKMGEEAAKESAPAVAEPTVVDEQPPAAPPEAAAPPQQAAPEERLWPCACPEYDMIGRQLAYWCVVKRDLLRLVRQVEGDCDCDCGGDCGGGGGGGGHHNMYITGTFHDLSLASINRAMHESVFLAVEHAHNIRSCYRAATGQHVLAPYDGEER